MKKFALSLIGILLVAVAFAQSANDKIVKLDGTEILCKVKEVGQTEIKYTKADNPDGPIYTIPKSEIRKIVYANGTEEYMQSGDNNMSVMPTKNRNYKRAITTRPFGPLLGFVCIGYQQALTPSRAIVGEVGFIGPKVGSRDRTASGGYARVGFRLKRTPEVVMQGMEWGYNLGGFYVQPELTFSAFTATDNFPTYDSSGNPITVSDSQKYNSGAFLITIGRQMVVGELMTFDLAGSVGYGYTSKPEVSLNNYEWDFRTQYFSHSMFGSSFPVAWKITFSMGIMLK